MFAVGKTKAEIGRIYKISRERVRQILLPPYEYVQYTHLCDVCGYEIKTRFRTSPECMQCKLKTNLENKSVTQSVFGGKPEWRRKGRERVREMVRHRDKYTCQSCGKLWKEGTRSFDVHHLNGLCGKKSTGYDSIKDMDGLITLCHKCHFNHPEHTYKIRSNH